MTARPATALRNSRRLLVVGVVACGVGLGFSLFGHMRPAIAAICASLFLNIIAIDGLRHVVANLREVR